LFHFLFLLLGSDPNVLVSFLYMQLPQVFGATNEGLLKNFLTIVSGQVVGQKSDTGDTRRIEIAQFLHLAVVGYHQVHF